MGWEPLMLPPAGSGLRFGTASSPKSIIRQLTGHSSGIFNISSLTAKAFSMTRNAISNSTLEHLSDYGLGYRCTNSDPDGRYSIVKEIIADPHLACVLQHTRLAGDESFISARGSMPCARLILR